MPLGQASGHDFGVRGGCIIETCEADGIFVAHTVAGKIVGWAQERLDDCEASRGVAREVVRHLEVHGIEHGALFDSAQDHRECAVIILCFVECAVNRGVVFARTWQCALCTFKGVSGQAELLEVVHALGTAGGFTGRLNGWKQQGDQNGDIAITTRSSIRVKPRRVADFMLLSIGTRS